MCVCACACTCTATDSIKTSATLVRGVTVGSSWPSGTLSERQILFGQLIEEETLWQMIRNIHPPECWPSARRQMLKEITGEEIQSSFIFLKPSSFIFSHLYNLFLCGCSLGLSDFFHHGDHSLSVMRYPDMIFLHPFLLLSLNPPPIFLRTEWSPFAAVIIEEASASAEGNFFFKSYVKLLLFLYTHTDVCVICVRWAGDFSPLISRADSFRWNALAFDGRQWDDISTSFKEQTESHRDSFLSCALPLPCI